MGLQYLVRLQGLHGLGIGVKEYMRAVEICWSPQLFHTKNMCFPVICIRKQRIPLHTCVRIQNEI